MHKHPVKPAVEIRAARAEDHDAIWQIFHEVVQAGDAFAFPSDTPRAEALDLWVAQPHATYVAEQQGRVVGSYFIKPNQPGRGAHVCNAGYMVGGEARRTGVGRAMCRHSLDEARRLGYQAMQFNMVVSTNLGALSLWQDLGFDVVGILPRAFDHAEHGLVDAYILYQEL
jgi:L-amino acid N-acyltransferase YncA